MNPKQIVGIALVLVGVFFLIPVLFGSASGLPPILGGGSDQKTVTCTMTITNQLISDVQFKSPPSCIASEPSLLSCISLPTQLTISQDEGSIRVSSGGVTYQNIGYAIPELTDSVKTFKRCIPKSISSLDFQLVNNQNNNIGGNSHYTVSI